MALNIGLLRSKMFITKRSGNDNVNNLIRVSENTRKN